MGTARHILAVLVAGIGDTVLGVPSLRALRAGFPGAEITLLGRTPPLELLEGCPYVDALAPFDLARFKTPGWALRPAAWRALARSLAPLRAQRFDIAANLYLVGTRAGGLRMAALLGWIGAPVTAGRRSPYGLPRYRVTADAAGHELESQLNVVRALGAPDAGTDLELWIRPGHRDACAAFLAEHGIGGDATIACLHPGSTKREGRWPAAGFAAVADRLAAAGARPVVTGGPEERLLAEAVAAASRARPAVAAGRLGLGALAALLQRAALLVTNDSGPMHVAAAAGCPLVALFGPTDPRAFGPRGHPAITRVLAAERPGPWDDAGWLRAMPPARVAAEAEALLACAPHRARPEA
jgi:ADP-heptose:LPS heptosyltransferase